LLNEQEGFKNIDGVNTFDIIIIVQMIEKLLRHGLVSGAELAHVAALRGKIIALVEKQIGINLDNFPKEGKKTDE
jgi:hypothetical protein